MLRPLRRTFPYGGVLDRILGLRFDPLARASAVLALSRAEVARLKARYPKQRIEHFPNGIDVWGQEGSEGTERREGRAPFARLLCVSRIDYQKNQLALLDLLAAEPACTLTLVGPVTADWYAAKIRARAKALGLEGRVTLVPGLPPDSPRLAEAYAAADVFVLPSLHEPFGIVALEAMRAGLPLLAANVGGLPDFVKDGAELNTKSDYCQVCGYDGEIEIVEHDGKLIWRCPNCGNTDQDKMNVARRTCGYIGTQFWNQGRTQEIKERVLHL